MQPSLLILAAGIGSRYGDLKQIDKFGPSGETIIDYSVYDAIQAGFKKVVFIIRKNIEDEFREVIGKKFEDKIQIEYAFQEIDIVPEGIKIPEERIKPWGTAHAIMMAKDIINEPFAVINADDFYGSEAFSSLGQYLSSLSQEDKYKYSMVGYQIQNTLSEHGYVSRGVCSSNKDNYLETVVERTNIYRTPKGIQFNENEIEHSLTGNEIVSMNFWGFMPSIFDHITAMFKDFLKENVNNPKAEFFIPLVVNNLIQEKKITLKVLESNASWFGITYKEDKPNAIKQISKLVEKGVYPNKLW